MSLHEFVAVIGGADPTDPLESDNRVRHTCVGALVLTIALWAFTATLLAFHSNLKAPWPVAVLGAAIIAAVVMWIDILITATVLKDDSVGSRLKVIAIRGMISLAMGLVISHATILFMYQSDLQNRVADTNNTSVAAITKNVTATSAQTPIITGAQTQIGDDRKKIQNENDKYAAAQQALTAAKTAWENDAVCVNGNRAANGDICGEGPEATPLRQAFQALSDQMPQVTKTHQDQLKALSDDLGTQNTTLTDAQKALKQEIADALKGTMHNTGLQAQNQALLYLLGHDWTAWLWPLFFIVIDLGVALMKGILPESDFDRSRRLRAPLKDRLATALTSTAAPAGSSSHLAGVLEYAAEQQALVERARIDLETQRRLAALRRRTARTAASTRPPWRRRAAVGVGVAGLLALALFATTALSGGTGHSTAAGSGPSTGMVARSGQSIQLQDGVTLTVPAGAISNNAPVTVAYAHETSWNGHTPVSQPMQLSTSGKIVGKPQLAIKVPQQLQSAAAAGTLQVAFESNDPSGWTAYPAAYDASAQTMTAQLTHFSTWEFWNWDWVSIGADISQGLGQLTGRRSQAVPDCSAAIPPPSWYNFNAGITADAGLVVRSCLQGHNGDDTLDVELVNNRPYGLTLSYGDAPIAWGWHEDATDLPGVLRQVIGDISVAGGKGLYLPPLSRASVGIKNIGNGKNDKFLIEPTAATLTGDVLNAVGEQLVGKVIGQVSKKYLTNFYAAAAGTSCSKLITGIGNGGVPNESTIYGILTGEGPQCMKDILTIAARNEIAQGADMDLKTIGDLSSAVTQLNKVLVSGWATLVQKLGDSLDLYTDSKAAWVDGLGYGFDILAHYTYAGPTSSPSTSSAPQSTSSAPPSTSSAPPSTSSAPQAVTLYDNYGSTADGQAMCRGGSTVAGSNPGGEATQTFTVPAGTTAITGALIQVDAYMPGSTVPVTTVRARLMDAGSTLADTTSMAVGDTRFDFGTVAVTPGQTLSLVLDFSASDGQIATVYRVGNPGGTFTWQNSCPDDNQSGSTSSKGLRAQIFGLGS